MPNILVKADGVVVRKTGLVGPAGVSVGILDPVTGHIPISDPPVVYSDIYAIAVWRKVDVLRLIVALLVPLPLAILIAATGISVGSVGAFLTVALILGVLGAYMIYDACIVKAHWVRVTGSNRVLNVRFDSPFWRRKNFHDELLRRAGISARNIP